MGVGMHEVLYTVCWTAQGSPYYCVPAHHWYALAPHQIGWIIAVLSFAAVRGVVRGLWIRRLRNEAVSANHGRWEHIGNDGGRTWRRID